MLTRRELLNDIKIDSRRIAWKSTMALIAVIFIVLTAATTRAAAPAQVKLTDQEISRAVDSALLTDAALLNNMIDAKVDDGIVTLSGTTSNLMTRERASKITGTIRGVRGVVNAITLLTPARKDEEIRKDVVSALYYDAATDSYELNVMVKEGVVTLTGTVQSYREKQLSAYVATGVKGVKDVINNIVLKSDSNRSDDEIVAEVRRILENDVWLATSYVTADVNDGVVILTGTVGSPSQHERAILLAWTAGVKSVNATGLNVEPWNRDLDLRDKSLSISDEEIKQAVKDAFFYDIRVYSTNPTIEVDKGVVTLTGVVTNLKAKRSAEQDAKNVAGVWRVKNLLKVRTAKSIPDHEIEKNVNAAFLRDPIVEGYQIDVKSKNGAVTLTGAVDSYYEKAEAEDIASRSAGTLNVKNNLTVNNPSLVYYDLGHDPYWSAAPFYSYRDSHNAAYSPYVSDAEVKEDIEDRIFWSPFVDLIDITVNVRNGIATLTGSAGSWFEFRKATENAFEGGAYQVYNNISVRKHEFGSGNDVNNKDKMSQVK